MIALVPPDPVVVVMLGAQSAGKSTLAGALAAQCYDALVISYDKARADISGDEADHSATPQAGQLVRDRLAARCAQRLTTIVDGTHVTATSRSVVLDLAHRHGLPAVAVVLATPLDVCQARQALRARQVPPDVIDVHHQALLAALRALFRERFAEIHILYPHKPRSDRLTTSAQRPGPDVHAHRHRV
ncbi:hypothetical protein GCM10029964_060590 [Kibdelosporangium lantanae]